MAAGRAAHLRWVFALGAIGLALASGNWTGTAAAEGERIASFDSQIEVGADAVLTVTETISVDVRGERIRHGIYRDFPTRYRGANGRPHFVGFEVLEVMRNGRAEPWRTERLDNGVRLYIGSRKVRLPYRTHTYSITYRSDRQIGFFLTHDELYWNVTGNGWNFAITEVSASVSLPDGARAHRVDAFTGSAGERGRDWIANWDDAGRAVFRTTRELGPGEGLTIVVGWPRGVIAPPRAELLHWWFRDNLHVLLAVAMLSLALFYQLGAWYRVGRDPASRTIIPRFAPPEDVSPAVAAYVLRMGWRDRIAAATAVSLAVQGYLTIRQVGAGCYRLARRDGVGQRLPGRRGERAFLKALFENEDDVSLQDRKSRAVWRAVSDLKTVLHAKCHGAYFTGNAGHAIFGLVLTIFALAALAFAAYVEATSTAVVLAITAAAFAALWHILFRRLMPALTRSGRRVVDELLGFRMYLATAERERLNLLNAPDRTPELFEKYLPYAMALDVEHEWGRQFSTILAAAPAAALAAGYQPAWYDGGADYAGFDFTPHGFASEMSESLASSVAAAAVPPGTESGFGEGRGGNGYSGSDHSSGGFSGGGASGGGGGGGGGGGW